MTIITMGNSDGESRCTAACYNATGKKCVCKACGGKNHGIGLQAALENNEQLLPEEAQDYLREQKIQLQLQFEAVS